ncbi:MAG: ECF transporter S component [bacterium]|nr:ECF transporter S component [bacterium]
MTSLYKLIHIALFAASGLVISQIFHAAGLGKAFLPLHFPVLIGGLLLGPWAGLAIGAFAPLISSLITGMPALFPMAPRMIAELAVLGWACGWFCHKYKLSHFACIPLAMLVSRITLAVCDTYIFVHLGRPPLSVAGNLSASLVSCLPGVIIQCAALPLLTRHLEKALANSGLRFAEIWGLSSAERSAEHKPSAEQTEPHMEQPKLAAENSEPSAEP